MTIWQNKGQLFSWQLFVFYLYIGTTKTFRIWWTKRSYFTTRYFSFDMLFYVPSHRISSHPNPFHSISRNSTPSCPLLCDSILFDFIPLVLFLSHLFHSFSISIIWWFSFLSPFPFLNLSFLFPIFFLLLHFRYLLFVSFQSSTFISALFHSFSIYSLLFHSVSFHPICCLPMPPFCCHRTLLCLPLPSLPSLSFVTFCYLSFPFFLFRFLSFHVLLIPFLFFFFPFISQSSFPLLSSLISISLLSFPFLSFSFVSLFLSLRFLPLSFFLYFTFLFFLPFCLPFLCFLSPSSLFIPRPFLSRLLHLLPFPLPLLPCSAVHSSALYYFRVERSPKL